jgi:hypothetical protein
VDQTLVPVDAKLTEQTSQLALAKATITQQNLAIADLKKQLATVPIGTTDIHVIDEMQTLTGTTETTGWVQPSNAGDTGGSDPTKPHGDYVFTPGAVAKFYVKPGYANNNFYFYTKRKGAQFDASRVFVQQLRVSFPTFADLNACEAIEFECQQSKDGTVHDAAWQIRHPGKENTLYTFDKRPATHGWKPSGLAPLPAMLWKPGVMIPITQTWRRNDDGTFTYLSLRINGVDLMTKPIVQASWVGVGQGNYLSVGFQLDTLNKTVPPAYSVNVESFRVVYAG